MAIPLSVVLKRPDLVRYKTTAPGRATVRLQAPDVLQY